MILFHKNIVPFIMMRVTDDIVVEGAAVSAVSLEVTATIGRTAAGQAA